MLAAARQSSEQYLYSLRIPKARTVCPLLSVEALLAAGALLPVAVAVLGSAGSCSQDLWRGEWVKWTRLEPCLSS